MKIRIIITALMLGLALPAAADMQTVAEAYEVSLSEMRLPSHESGTISYKTCGTCSYETKRVGSGTRYLLNGKAVKLDEFRRASSLVTERADQPVTVLRHLGEDVVTQVSMTIL